MSGKIFTRLLGDSSIQRQLIGAVALILALFAVSGLISLIALDSVNRARIGTGETHAALARSQQLGESIAAQESALRGYALTGAKRYETEVRTAATAVESSLRRLRDASGHDDAEKRLLDEIGRLESGWQAQVAEPVMGRVDAGAIASARKTLINGVSVAYIEPMRQTLSKYQDRLENDLAQRNADIADRQWMADTSLVVLLIVGLLIGLATMIRVRRQIATPLLQLTDVTRRLAGGERNVEVRFQHRDDEIGAMSRALEKFRQIIVRQDRDYWIRDHRGRMTAMLYHCADDRELGRSLLDELAPLMHAGYAAVFTRASLDDEDSDFTLLAAYGYSPQAEQRFASGEGLIGAALEARRPIELSDIPAGYIPVRSGLGQAEPKMLLIVPTVIADQVVAIIELALFHPLTETERDLLDTLSPNIAMAVLTQMRARHTNELLARSREQTQLLSQSEKRLSQQQDSLRRANTELRAQSEELSSQAAELRASEEELKSQADELQAANANLREQQEELSALHAQAEERAEELERANEYKSGFLANMSHELRTPLNSLLILSRSLADNDSGNLDEDQVEAARIIHDAGNGLLTLINDILDLSKIEAGKMRVLAGPVETADFAARIRRQFAHMAEAQGLDFEVVQSADAPERVVTDAGKLEQIVRNLVSNAIKFTREGGVRVHIDRPGEGVRFACDGLRPDNALAIQVSDDGIGIPEDRLDHIFHAFEQVDGSSSRSYGGTGLGLSITRELAGLLGGEVAVESMLGQGSRFTVFVRTDLALADDIAAQEAVDALEPAANEHARPRQNQRRHQKTPGQPPRVLVIDDDAPFADIICKTARGRGFEAESASDGQSALAAIAKRAPDAVILDLGLPGELDGWAVLDRIKADPDTRHIPVHIVSAADDTGRSASAGAIGYLCKPVTRENLDTLLSRAETLSGRKARRVLVVDDDPDAHAAIARLLRGEQVETVAVNTGAAALARLDAEAFDCLVLDLKLPDISGFDLLDAIAGRADAPPVVVYSARDLSAEETARLRDHTDSIVIKGNHAQDRLLDEISLFMHRLAPAPAIAPAAAPPVRELDGADLSGARVLLVDDDMRNTFALSRMLRGRGVEVVMAADGFKALDRLAEADDLDLVLMDIMMPGMDGYETMRRIRAGSDHPRVPIIALTAKAMSDDREACLAAGADAYLSKPLDVDRLIECMQELVA
ncbi:response regulator [Salinisphaera sp.]|uniref:response regulator n=1 Tax=Salinisphaera sp. TaxID=1914330 RepID=UPI002D77CEF5|nr:response regulator [Salinisphaera sp.]HET7315704.1 response regulator [Salinisphaera sp.]